MLGTCAFQMKSKPNGQAEDSIAHFQQVLELAHALASRGVAIRGHEYDPHFFGMWKIVAGSFEHRFQFLWDDRDQVLTICEAEFQEFGNSSPDWAEIEERIIDRRSRANPFAYIDEFLAGRIG